ncbi:tRNA 2-thiocytidine biosynthesis protein TtcA [Budvicia aquatica]|uniref:tRNA 2-thiocytidine biosynthesis protein TtcA n=1 Tax=Budvicia aquatica TaxID=82979 RepID=A0A484ZUA2_9GAMM|nr:tRNA 2-thiocytidine biosynthesis protein TtcA [Budvicia aquatica]
MLNDWDRRYPGRIETMFSAMQDVVPSHLCDRELFDFGAIQHGMDVIDGGDLAFESGRTAADSGWLYPGRKR